MDHSYSYQNQVRDLGDLISATMRVQPIFLSLIRIGAPARNRKHEWLEDVLRPTQDAAASTVLAAATSVDVETGTSFAAYDIWVNVETDERFEVTAVAGNTITITRGVGGTAADITTGDVLKLVSRPKLEGTDPGDDAGQEPTTEHNYTQIFDRTAKVTLSAQAQDYYGIEDQLDYQVKVQVDQLVREMNMTTIFGVRRQPTASVRGTMGGILSFLDQAGGNRVNAGGSALSKANLNDALEMAFNDGANDLVMVCGPTQARKVTALDSNYEIVRGDTTAGKVIMEYRGDIAGSNAASRIVVDPNYPKTRIDFVDVSRLALVPLNGRGTTDKDATPPGADYVARRIIGEYTLEMKNALDAHASVYGLSV